MNAHRPRTDASAPAVSAELDLPPEAALGAPFVFALLPDPRNQRGSEPGYLAYLVNLGATRVERVVRDTGGFASCDDELIVATGRATELGALEPREALLVSKEGPGSFDFTVWWELELELAGGARQRLAFAVPRNFPVCRHDAEWRHVPTLAAEAWVLAAR